MGVPDYTTELKVAWNKCSKYRHSIIFVYEFRKSFENIKMIYAQPCTLLFKSSNHPNQKCKITFAFF